MDRLPQAGNNQAGRDSYIQPARDELEPVNPVHQLFAKRVKEKKKHDRDRKGEEEKKRELSLFKSFNSLNQ